MATVPDQQWYADNPGWPDLRLLILQAIERFLRRLVHQLYGLVWSAAVAALSGAITSKRPSLNV